jgi:methionine sulfoxide reductase heme-binding subunit
MSPPKGRSARPLAWLKPGVFTGSLFPVVSVLYRAARGTLGANPVAEALNELGLTALALLILSLACTPAKILFGVTWPIRIRRMLGVMAFVYATLHILTYAGVDQLGNFSGILEDVAKRPFIAVGFLAWLILVPLAITSTAKMTKRLGAVKWKRLHRLAYVATVLGVVHFVWRVKKDVTEPAVYGTILGVLLLVRLVDAWGSPRPSPRVARGS